MLRMRWLGLIILGLTCQFLLTSDDLLANDMYPSDLQMVDDVSIPSEEYAALVALYNSTNGPNWSNNVGWLSDPNPCNWYGVSCFDDHVTVLQLPDNQLTGIIPPELGELANLEMLLLYGNALDGTIPPALGQLNQLRWLLLNDNHLSGSIPTGLANLINLKQLHLGTNQLSGSIPPELGNLASLEGLRLSDNQLIGTIPPALSNLSRLTWLDLSANQLSGNIPAGLANLARLTWLDLTHNQLTGLIPPNLSELAWLQGLHLAHNQLSGPIPAELGSLRRLRVLDLSQNQLSGQLPPALGELARLQRLYLNGNAFLGELPETLINVNRIFALNIDYNGLTSIRSEVVAFMDVFNPGWSATQTIPPTDIEISSTTGTTMEMRWTPIPYTMDGGYYEVRYATISGGPYDKIGCTTIDKAATGCIVTGLNPDTEYFAVVRTFSQAHNSNPLNDIWSVTSGEVTAYSNRAPVLALVGDQSVDEAATRTITVSASDPELSPLFFIATGVPGFASFTDNGDNTASLVAAPGFDDAGIYSITVTASDGDLTASETFVLTVNDVDPASLVTLTGRVGLQGRPAGPTSLCIVPLIIEFKTPGTSDNVIAPKTVFTDENCEFSVSNIPPDTYDLLVRNMHSLSNIIPNVTMAIGDNEVCFDTLHEGDANQDGVVDVADRSQLAGYFLTQVNSVCPNTSVDCGNWPVDFNGDGVVDIVDYSLLATNYQATAQTITDPVCDTAMPISSDVATLHIESDATQVIVGDEFGVTIEIDTGGEPLVGVQAFLNFDPQVLHIVDVMLNDQLDDVLRSTFDNRSGHLNIVAGQLSTPYPTGTVTLLTARMRAVGPATAATLTFETQRMRETKAVSTDGVSILGNRTSVSVAVVMPTATPTFTPTSTSTTAPVTPVTNTVGLYDRGVWRFRERNSSADADMTFAFGPANQDDWQPITGDWNGDSTDGVGLYRNGVWVLRQTSGSGTFDDVLAFGQQEPGWQAISGDWNGDGRDGPGLYKDGLWLLYNNGMTRDMRLQFEPVIGGRAISGDWDGDGVDTIGIYKDGMWYLAQTNSNQPRYRMVAFGPKAPGWRSVIGDWNQDGYETPGLYQDGLWLLTNLDGGSDMRIRFGSGGWPVANYRGGMGALNALSMPPATATPVPTMTPTQMPPSSTPIPEITADVTSTSMPTGEPASNWTSTPVPEITSTADVTSIMTPSSIDTPTWSVTLTSTVPVSLTASSTIPPNATPMPTSTPLPSLLSTPTLTATPDSEVTQEAAGG